MLKKSVQLHIRPETPYLVSDIRPIPYKKAGLYSRIYGP